MSGDNEQFMTTDERIGNMFRSAIAPLPDPDQAFVNRALAARAASGVSNAGTPPAAATNTEAEPWYKRMARESAAGEMRAGKAAEETVASMPRQDTESENLQRKIETENKPIQSRDASGKVLPEYRATLGQKVLRGFIGAGRGLRQGGVLGAAEGAIDPRGTYAKDDPRRQYAGYGDPNKTYQTAETNRQRDLAADTQSLDTSMKRFKEATDRAKGIAQEERAVATTYKDAGATANKAEADATAAKKVEDAENKVVEPKTLDEIALAKQQALARGDKAKAAIYDGALKEIERVKQSEKLPRDTTAQDIAKAIQVAEFRSTETMKVDKAKEDERNRRYAEADKNIKLKYDDAKLAAEKQRIDSELEQKYATKYQDVSDKADQMLGLTKAGKTLQSKNQPTKPAAPAASKPASQQAGTPPVSLWKGKEGKILTLDDGTGTKTRWKLVDGKPQQLQTKG